MSTTLMLKLTDDTSVRGIIAPDGSQRYSVYDFITLACQKSDGGSYARKTFSNFVKDESNFKEEVGRNVLNLKFPGAGQRDTPTMTLRGLQRLLLILGNKVASEFRVHLEGTFSRVMAGDHSLIEVICSNAASDAPIHQAYRQALAQEPVAATVLDEIVSRKRKAEWDQALFDIEIRERNIDIRERIAKVRDGDVARIRDFASVMDMLNPDWKSDSRLRLQVEDSLKNTLFGEALVPSAAAVTNGEDGAVPLTQSVSIGEVAQKMGYSSLKHADQVGIGRMVAKAYHRRHGQQPSKHRQWVDGAERAVNSYTEADRDLIEAAIKERMVVEPSDDSD